MKKITFILFITIFLTTALYGMTTEKYSKVASMTLGGDEIILSLIPPDRIAGLSGKINKDEQVSNIVHKAHGFPEIEGNIEVVMNLEPDLIITGDWVDKEYLLQLKDTGIDTYIYKTPVSWEEQVTVIKELSHLLNAEKQGNEIIMDMEQRLQKLQRKIRDQYKGKKPDILLYSSMGTTNGKNTFFDSITKCLLANNIASANGINKYEKISKEKVIEINPDILIIPIWNKHPDNENFLDFIKNDKSFQELKAVKNNRVYAIDYRYISTTSQYIIDGIEKLGEKIYNLN